jgi:hypothetical protein
MGKSPFAASFVLGVSLVVITSIAHAETPATPRAKQATAVPHEVEYRAQSPSGVERSPGFLHAARIAADNTVGGPERPWAVKMGGGDAIRRSAFKAGPSTTKGHGTTEIRELDAEGRVLSVTEVVDHRAKAGAGRWARFLAATVGRFGSTEIATIDHIDMGRTPRIPTFGSQVKIRSKTIFPAYDKDGSPVVKLEITRPDASTYTVDVKNAPRLVTRSDGRKVIVPPPRTSTPSHPGAPAPERKVR